MINKKEKFIYIHLNKCGGSSVDKVLLRFAKQRKKFGVLLRREIITKQRKKFGGHQTIRDYEDTLGSEALDDYFKFSFVRNPWDKIVSFYFFHKKKGWSCHPWSHNITFKKFVTEKLNIRMPFSHSKYSSTMRTSNHYDWFLDSTGKNRMDFVGRFENLQADFNIACVKAGIRRMGLPHANMAKRASDNSMIHGRAGHYSQYYDEETREIVAKRFSKDISEYGYEFKQL